MLMNSLRTIRKVVIQPVNTKMNSRFPRPRLLTMATNIMTSTSWGNAWKISEIRISAVSIFPPKYPATAPKIAPITELITAQNTPIKME